MDYQERPSYRITRASRTEPNSRTHDATSPDLDDVSQDWEVYPTTEERQDAEWEQGRILTKEEERQQRREIRQQNKVIDDAERLFEPSMPKKAESPASAGEEVPLEKVGRLSKGFRRFIRKVKAKLGKKVKPDKTTTPNQVQAGSHHTESKLA